MGRKRQRTKTQQFQGPQLIWVDEMTEIDDETWNKMFATLRPEMSRRGISPLAVTHPNTEVNAAAQNFVAAYLRNHR